MHKAWNFLIGYGLKQGIVICQIIQPCAQYDRKIWNLNKFFLSQEAYRENSFFPPFSQAQNSVLGDDVLLDLRKLSIQHLLCILVSRGSFPILSIKV
jgi:hypothetical protein